MAKRGLGKGLDALIKTNAEELGITTDDADKVVTLKISQVEPNKNQPRHTFDEEKLEILAESIKQHGVIQPIIVTDLNNGFYRIVAGERRWRASRMAGIKEIPAIIRSYDELATMEVALIENLQREDLNPIEEALGYKSLMDAFDMTQDSVSKRVAKSRSAIANALRLLSLPKKIQELVSDRAISSGHARAILAVENDKNRLLLADKIVEEGISVRQAEELAKKLNETKAPAPVKENKINALDFQVAEIQERISQLLGTKVKITNGARKGKIEIEYYGTDDLGRVLNLLKL